MSGVTFNLIFPKNAFWPGPENGQNYFFETGLIPIVKKQKLLSFARVSRILILTVFGRQKFIKRVSGLDSRPMEEWNSGRRN